MGKIKTNFRKRIKELGYTREQFANICNISEETLKKYLSKDDYPTRWLKVFADKLKCTYDYLLGESEVPERQHQDIRNETGLSIQSVHVLKQYKNKDKSKIINCILENEKLLAIFQMYFDMPKEANEIIKNNIDVLSKQVNMDKQENNEIDFDMMLMIELISEIKVMKQQYNQNKKG